MRIKTIGGSHLDTTSEEWGLDQITWELMWAEEAAMRKSLSIPVRQAGYENHESESVSDLPRIQKSHKEKSFVGIPMVMRICATSN